MQKNVVKINNIDEVFDVMHGRGCVKEGLVAEVLAHPVR